MAPKKEKRPGQVSIQNRKARYNYAISDEIEAGIVLTGSEVKSLRLGKANIADAFAGEMKGELWLFNADIAVFAQANRMNHEPRRPRKLLVHKKQMNKLIGATKNKGVTIVPIALYFNAKGYAKVQIGLGTGKKEYEKRDTIKQRDWEREKGQIMRK
jgi:SsrA-binding protein